MARKVKYRAKTLNYDPMTMPEWAEGFYYQELHRGKMCHLITDGAHTFEVDENSLGQFTGLHDKTGKEIYEGDILRYYIVKEYRDCLTTDPIPYYQCEYRIEEIIATVKFDNGVFWCDTSDDDCEVLLWVICAEDSSFSEEEYNSNMKEEQSYFNPHNIAYSDLGKVEIIGSIHDNPELLKGDEQ